MEREKLIYEMFLKQIALLHEKYEWIAQQTGESFNILSKQERIIIFFI